MVPLPRLGRLVSTARLHGWSVAPRVGIVVPEDGRPGWTDAAFWCALLEAWGVPSERAPIDGVVLSEWTTLIVPTSVVDEDLAGAMATPDGAAILLTGAATADVDRLEGQARVTRFTPSADELEPGTSEATVDAAEEALAAAAPEGLVSLWRWPNGKDVALVVDGDVDHPTGIDPECARYVAPAIETARRAGFKAYGIFAAAANVDAEPASFPTGADYYNHSYTHPYSHWNDDTWDSLDEARMRQELTRSNDAFRRHLGADDHRLFRVPHFQLTAFDRTYDVLERLGYLAESSIGGNVSITAGLPFHPARRPWSDRPADAAYARTHPDPSKRRPFLQVPISTDPTHPAFPHGCCSYNTLGEGVRNRTADPNAYERVLQEVLDRAAARQSLAHLFIDPPDAGFGRLHGDSPDYASAVERWLARALQREDVAILTLTELTRWWLARERMIGGLSCRLEGEALVVDLRNVPEGVWLAVRPPGNDRTWRRVPVEEGR
ncbi:MAG TPA: polysaccharide deacetylase family protein [Actinomycetota bacterium]|nr:polysaccharide deacetylase family protein [Actinomycetota bacterium]